MCASHSIACEMLVLETISIHREKKHCLDYVKQCIMNSQNKKWFHLIWTKKNTWSQTQGAL